MTNEIKLDSDVRVGDYGTTFELTITDGPSGAVVDISAATTLQIVFVKPDNTKLTKTGVKSSDGTDGKMKYVSVPNDIDMVGSWHMQGYVVTPSTGHHATIVHFDVLPVL